MRQVDGLLCTLDQIVVGNVGIVRIVRINEEEKARQQQLFVEQQHM